MVSFLPMEDCESNCLYIIPNKTKNLEDMNQGYTYFRDNDLFLTKMATSFESSKMSIVQNCESNIGFGSTEFIVLRAKEEVLAEWVYYCLRSSEFLQLGKETIRGTAHQRINPQFVSNYSIPIPPLEIQKEFIEQLKRDEKDKENLRLFINNQKEKETRVLKNIWQK